jgi:hypothetical protein
MKIRVVEKMRLTKQVLGFAAIVLFCSVSMHSQSDVKQFNKEGLLFEYVPGWTLQDDSNSDAQQIILTRGDSDAQIRVFAHRGKVTPEKMAQARKSLIDPYIDSTAKQFVAMGAKPEQSPDATDIGTTKAEGVNIKAVLGGDPGAARIYWALIGQRVVVLTFFGPDRDLKKHAAAWDRVRTSLQIEEKKPDPKPSPTP